MRPDRPPSRPSSKENEINLRDSREPNDDLEALDINQPAQPSREARLQDRRERLRSSSQEGSAMTHQENKEEFQALQADDDESRRSTQDKKIKAPSGPRPPPRKAADLRDDDDDDSDGNLSDTNRRDHGRPLASTEIDDLRNAPLIVNLDDSDDDGDEMDFKVRNTRRDRLMIFLTRLRKEDTEVIRAMTNHLEMMELVHVLLVLQLNHKPNLTVLKSLIRVNQMALAKDPISSQTIGMMRTMSRSLRDARNRNRLINKEDRSQ